MEEEAVMQLNQAKIFYRKVKCERALQYLSSLLESNPGDAYLTAFSSLCKVHTERLAEAEKDAQAALKIDGKLGLAHCALAAIRGVQQKKSEAEAEFGKAAQLAPSDGLVFFERAQFYKANGKNAEAAADLEKAASLDAVFKDAASEALELKKAIPAKPTLGAISNDVGVIEITNEWFSATVPKGWGVDVRDKLFIFRLDDDPAITFSVSIISGDKEKIAGMDSSFYQFVEGEMKTKPYKIMTRKMRGGTAKEAHVASDSGKGKTHCVFLGYPTERFFYLLEFSAPDSAPADSVKAFNEFAANFLPAGISADKAKQVGVGGGTSLVSLVLSVVLALIGVGIIIGAAYVLFTAPEIGKVNAPFITFLVLVLVGFILIANTAFKLNPKLVYMLNLIFYLLVLVTCGVAYSAFSSSSMLLFGSAGKGGVELTGVIAQAVAVLLIVLGVILMIAGIVIILYSKTRKVELEEAYIEVYGKISEKLRRK